MDTASVVAAEAAVAGEAALAAFLAAPPKQKLEIEAKIAAAAAAAAAASAATSVAATVAVTVPLKDATSERKEEVQLFDSEEKKGGDHSDIEEGRGEAGHIPIAFVPPGVHMLPPATIVTLRVTGVETVQNVTCFMPFVVKSV